MCEPGMGGTALVVVVEGFVWIWEFWWHAWRMNGRCRKVGGPGIWLVRPGASSFLFSFHRNQNVNLIN